MLFCESVHDRVAAVREDHEQHAGAIVRSAPERLDPVEGRTVADDRDDRALGQRHAQPGCSGESEPEPAHSGAQRPERLARREADQELGPVRWALLEDDCVARKPLGECSEDVPGAEWLTVGRRRGRCGTLERVGARAVPCGHGPRELGADCCRVREDSQLGIAPVHLGRILADHGDPGSSVDERARVIAVLAKGRPADDQHEVVRLQRLAEANAIGGEVPGEQRMVLGKPGPGAEGLLPDRAPEPLDQRDECFPRLVVVGTGAGDDHGVRRSGDELGELRDGVAVRRGVPQDAARRRPSVGLVRLSLPVVHGDDHQGRPAGGSGLVIGTSNGSGNILSAGWLIDPDGILAGERSQLAGEKRLRGEMPAILLADHDDEGRPVDASRGQGSDGVAEPGGRVQDR